jgi:hypothetical protein
MMDDDEFEFAEIPGWVVTNLANEALTFLEGWKPENSKDGLLVKSLLPLLQETMRSIRHTGYKWDAVRVYWLEPEFDLMRRVLTCEGEGWEQVIERARREDRWKDFDPQ